MAYLACSLEYFESDYNPSIVRSFACLSKGRVKKGEGDFLRRDMKYGHLGMNTILPSPDSLLLQGALVILRAHVRPPLLVVSHSSQLTLQL